jgi:hypothetical protein
VRSALGLAVGVAALLAPHSNTSAGPGEGEQRRCQSSGSRLVAASEDATVWRARLQPGQGERFYACFRDRRQPIALGVERFDQELANFRVAERFVAYTNQGCGRVQSTCEGAVVVRDLRERTARRVRIPPGHGEVFSLVLSERGAIAWSWLATPDAGLLELRALDREGERVLATAALATEIDPDSLAISRSHVFWIERGGAMSAAVGAYFGRA